MGSSGKVCLSPSRISAMTGKKSITTNLPQHNKTKIIINNGFVYPSVYICALSVHPHPTHTDAQKKVESWITGPCFSSFPSFLSQPLPFVIKEGNTFSVGLFVYWFPPLFGELGTKTEFILSWPPALSLNTPHLSFSFSCAQHPLSMDE